MTKRTWPDLSDSQLRIVLEGLQTDHADGMTAIAFERVMQQLMRERDALREQLADTEKHRLDWAQPLRDRNDALRAEIERLRAALTEITDLDLEGDASLADAIVIADETLNPPPDDLVSDKAS